MIPQITQQINNLYYQPEDHDYSSFAESCNQGSRFFRKSRLGQSLNGYNNNQANLPNQNQQQILFPDIKAPTVSYTDESPAKQQQKQQQQEPNDHSQNELYDNEDNQSSFSKAQSAILHTNNHRLKQNEANQQDGDDRASLHEIIEENLQLKKMCVFLKKKIELITQRQQILAQTRTQDDRGSENRSRQSNSTANTSNKHLEEAVARIRQECIFKDREIAELKHSLDTIQEEFKQANSQLLSSNKNLAAKTMEARKQKDRYDALMVRFRQSLELSQAAQQKITQLTEAANAREEEVKKLKQDNVLLNSTLRRLQTDKETRIINNNISDSIQRISEKPQSSSSAYEFHEQAKRSNNNQSKRNVSLRGSTASSATTMSLESFSPEVLSPEETVALIFQVFRRISKSARMLKILKNNGQFVDLIREFVDTHL